MGYGMRKHCSCPCMTLARSFKCSSSSFHNCENGDLIACHRVVLKNKDNVCKVSCGYKYMEYYIHYIHSVTIIEHLLLLLLLSCFSPTLSDPIDGSPPGSPVPGILQARTLEWVAISFSNARR